MAGINSIERRIRPATFWSQQAYQMEKKNIRTRLCFRPTQMPADIEHKMPAPEHPNGFPTVAHFITQDRDNISTIYRRFDALSARNLLYLQSHLQRLEADQAALDDELLKTCNRDSKNAASSWEAFELFARDGLHELERRRMELAKDIKTALREYHETLLMNSDVLKLQHPSTITLQAFRKKLDLHTGVSQLRGHSRTIYTQDDLIALYVPPDQDRLTRFIRHYFPWIFVTSFQPSHSPSAVLISERALSRFVAVLSTFVVAGLLIGAIATLNFVTSQDWRLGVIALFTIGFAASVALLTNASRAEVYAATAGYAAVLGVSVTANPTVFG
ncbi:hypothetical protein MMC27_004917 [Xylographa pallens]|nr:hypothetical protein [Xylographa pallens]